MRTTWNGSLTFGLVSIPVGLAPATKPAARQSDVSFRLLHRECLTPIKQKRWCPKHDRELAPDEIVKGWEASKGHFVIVEEAELEALEARDDSRSIEISRFVPVEEIDSIWRDRSYFLVPGATAAQRRPYKLLLEAMRDTGTGALGRFVRSGRESLCLVRARGDSLVLETLYLADDVYSDAEITEAVGTAEVKAPELELAHQIIDSLEGDFDPKTLTSTYRRDLKALLEAKLDGAELPPPDEPEEPAAPAVDLLEALRASVEAAKGGGGGAKPAAKAKAKKPASKSAAKSRSRASK
jgi:DNA end-binding protein Ku